MSAAAPNNPLDTLEVALPTIEPAQQTAARVAGFAYLITFATVVYVNFGIHDRLIVEHNAAETARNILAHERLFRIGIARLRLPPKPLQSLRVLSHIFRQKLESYKAVETGVFGFVDHTHATAA